MTSQNQTALGQIRRQADDIESRLVEVEVLAQTIFLKIDHDPAQALTAINCYATCILRNVALIEEHRQHIIALTAAANEIGGAQ
jgi:hypothetical protein